MSLNQDLSAKSLRLRTDNSGVPDIAKQQAWLRAMEQSQMQEWLRQGLTARGGHDTPVAEDTSNARELSQKHHQDDAEKTGDRETVNDAQADSRSNGSAKQAASIEGVDKRNFVAQDARANEALPAASSVQRSSSDSTVAEVENENSEVKQQVSASGMTAFAANNLASSPGTVQSSIATGSALPLAGEFAQGGQAVQTIKIALQEMTGIEAKIVSAESLNQMADVDKQTNQPVSRLAASLSKMETDTAELEKSAIKEESASAKAADNAESLPEEHQVIRFHAEWSEEGLRLWLGINSNANIDKAQLTKQLHDWVAKQNVQLLALIWNGEQLPKNVIAQMLKEGANPSASSLTNSKPSDVANAPGVEDTHYFLNSYLQAKEMQWPSVQ
ncbi:hypothetical protein ACO0LD_14620 [Undibacterium sp. Ji83W]|uniref:hypothetical protein n=1 Tax=Undibacterium sp. Ji83W TaxID=3413043 RepID=UPI003BF3F68B